MNRRKFFSFLSIGAAAAVVAPKMLTAEPKPQDVFEDIDWDAIIKKHEDCKHPGNRIVYTRVPLFTTTVIWGTCSICSRLVSNREVERTKEDEEKPYMKTIRPAWFDGPEWSGGGKG